MGEKLGKKENHHYGKKNEERERDRERIKRRWKRKGEHAGAQPKS
jgi:hypothetical protein